MTRRETVLTITLSALIITVGVLGSAYVQTLHERDVANRKLQQTNECITLLEDHLAGLAAVERNSTIFREQAIGAYLDFGNCLAKINDY